MDGIFRMIVKKSKQSAANKRIMIWEAGLLRLKFHQLNSLRFKIAWAFPFYD